MVQFRSIKKGEEVLLRNGTHKVAGIEKYNKSEVIGVRRDGKWKMVTDNRSRLFEIFQFFRW